MSSAADVEELKKQFKAWRKLCPTDVGKVEDVVAAKRATVKLDGALTSAKAQLRGKSGKTQSSGKAINSQLRGTSTGSQETTAKGISEMLKTLKDYSKELEEPQERLSELKRWLARVRTSADPLPFALVAKGNSKGELHVHKAEKRVERGARAGKQDLSGAKIHEGECQYKEGKLAFTFDNGARAPWKSLLQGMVNQAGVNMKVALDGPGDDDTSDETTVA